MSASPDPASRPDSAPGPDDAGEPASAAAVAMPTAWLWTWGVGASLTAGLAAWLVGEGRLVAYREQLTPSSGPFPPPEVGLAVIASNEP